MKNSVYEKTVAAMSAFLGARPQQLESGNGCRFANAAKGKATVYCADIASGNQAEIAFDAASVGKRLGLAASECAPYFARLATVTGRPVLPNARFNWPRAGIETEEDLAKLMAHLEAQGPTTG